jgi:hypothetical protein
MINRSADKIQFLTQPYRVRVEAKGLLRSIDQYSSKYGPYICLIPKSDDYFELILSKEKGALLGEHVREWFKEYTNFIYCETLVAGKILLVIVVNGDVFVDELIDQTQFEREITLWFNKIITSEDFKVFYYGKNLKNFFMQHVPGDILKKNKTLNRSVFENVPINKKLIVGEKNQALKALGLSKWRKRALLISLSSVIIVCLMTYVLWPKSVQPIISVNPYLAYQQMLTRPAPVSILNAVARVIDKVTALSNLEPKRLIFNGSSVQINFQQKYRISYQALHQWIQKNQATFLMKSDKNASINFYPRLMKRETPDTIVRLKPSLYQLIDQVNQGLPNVGLNLDQPISHGAYQAVSISIVLKDASTETLKVLGRLLKDYPLVLKKVDLQWHGILFEGKIELEMLGKAS